MVSLGVFATVAGELIRNPQDGVTRWVTESLSLEHAPMVGVGVFVVGAASAGSLVAQWITTGFGTLSFTMGSMVAFTAIVIGLQTVFSAFFLSAVKK